MFHVPIHLRICKVISHIAFSFRILGRQVALSVAGQLKIKTRDFCVIRESKPLGGYIMNFYRPKYVSYKKTEFREHTRCPRGRGRAQEDRACPQLKIKTRDFCVIRESKPLGGYIMNFYRPKYVSYKKTEFREHTRCPRGRGRAQEDRACPPPSWGPRVLPRLLLIFLFF